LIRNPKLQFGSVTIPALNWGIDGVFWTLTALTVTLVVANFFLFTPHMESSERNSPLPEGSGRIDQFLKGLALATVCGLIMGTIIHDTTVHPQLWAVLWIPLAIALASIVTALSARSQHSVCLLYLHLVARAHALCSSVADHCPPTFFAALTSPFIR
jgi:hypothetical protein